MISEVIIILFILFILFIILFFRAWFRSDGGIKSDDICNKSLDILTEKMFSYI